MIIFVRKHSSTIKFTTRDVTAKASHFNIFTIISEISASAINASSGILQSVVLYQSFHAHVVRSRIWDV